MISQVTVIGRPQPKTWDDYRQGALANYGGGHHTDGHLEAFHHGMETVFNLLESEFPDAQKCKAADDLLNALKALFALLDPDIGGSKGSALENARAAIAKAEGGE